ncbi:MAG: hypothetical protein ACF8QF_11355 [Phycisphaerales bacterium]
MMIRALTLAAGLAAASSAHAGFVGWDMRVDSAATAAANGVAGLETATVYRMYAVFDDGGNVVVNVFNANFGTTDGSTLWQTPAPFGGTVAPNAGFFGFDATLQFDSFVTLGELSNNGTTSIAPDADFAWAANGVAAGGWFNNNPPNLLGESVQNGSVWETLVGQFTVLGGTRDLPGPTGNGDGRWEGLASITFNQGIGTATTQLADQGFIPTPGAMALFGIAGLTASRRRRSA